MLHIKSQIPALIEIDKQYLLENPIQKVSFEDQDLIIKYYPLQKTFNGKQTLPSIINIKLASLENCKEYLITLYPNNNIEILLQPFTLDINLPLNKTSNPIENSTKKLDLFLSHNTTIALQSNNNYFYHTLDYQLEFVKAVEIDNCLHILLSKANDYYYLKIKNDNIQCSCLLSDASFLKNQLVATIPYFDMAKHGKLIEISFVKPYGYNEKIIYLNKKPKLIENPLLLPYAFVESIKAKNFKLARFYMTKTMSEKLSNETLQSFFGNIKSITHDTYNDKICIITKNNNVFVAKDYTFDFEDNKISNINEV